MPYTTYKRLNIPGQDLVELTVFSLPRNFFVVSGDTAKQASAGPS